MILDRLLIFTGGATQAATLTGQAITVTAPSTDVLGLVNFRDLGVGDDPAMKVMIRVTEVFAGGTSVQVQFQGSVDDSTYTTYAESDAIAAAALTAGALHVFAIHLPRRRVGAALPKFYRLNFVVVGTFTTGKLVAGLVLDDHAWDSYAAGLTVAN